MESELGLSPRDIAGALGLDQRTVERWSRPGGPYPQRAARQRLADLLNLSHRLRESFVDANDAREWLRSPSRFLGGLTPTEVIRAGRADRVEAALEAIDSGIFI